MTDGWETTPQMAAAERAYAILDRYGVAKSYDSATVRDAMAMLDAARGEGFVEHLLSCIEADLGSVKTYAGVMAIHSAVTTVNRLAIFTTKNGEGS